MVTARFVNPPGLGKAVGYSNGVRAGHLLFVAGQIGTRLDAKGSPRLVGRGFLDQFDQALANVVEVVREAGASPESIVELTIYVTNMAAYRRARKTLGEAWKRRMGRHYPAVALVGVAALYERGAVVEIQGVADLEHDE